MILVSDLRPGTDCVISLVRTDGSIARIIVLTEEQADRAWVLERQSGRDLFLSQAGMYVNQDRIFAMGNGSELKVSRLGQSGFTETIVSLTGLKDGDSATTPEARVTLLPHPLFADAAWIESANFTELPAYMERYHRFFFKEFSLGNPSPVRKATLYIFPEKGCSLNLNEKWIRQEVRPGVVNAIDLTGYVQKGNNLLFLDFPYLEGRYRFAARLVVDYLNYDRVEFHSDASWLQTDMYTHPSGMRPYDKPQPATLVSAPDQASTLAWSGFAEWDIVVPREAMQQVHAQYLTLDYRGDRAELYNGHVLAADDFNVHLPWTIGLQRLNPPAEGKTLRLVIYPLSRESKIYFDIPPTEKDFNTADVTFWEANTEHIIQIK